jgi:hypothetical protein
MQESTQPSRPGGTARHDCSGVSTVANDREGQGLIPRLRVRSRTALSPSASTPPDASSFDYAVPTLVRSGRAPPNLAHATPDLIEEPRSDRAILDLKPSPPIRPALPPIRTPPASSCFIRVGRATPVPDPPIRPTSACAAAHFSPVHQQPTSPLYTSRPFLLRPRSSLVIWPTST